MKKVKKHIIYYTIISLISYVVSSFIFWELTGNFMVYIIMSFTTLSIGIIDFEYMYAHIYIISTVISSIICYWIYYRRYSIITIFRHYKLFCKHDLKIWLYNLLIGILILLLIKFTLGRSKFELYSEIIRVFPIISIITLGVLSLYLSKKRINRSMK